MKLCGAVFFTCIAVVISATGLATSAAHAATEAVPGELLVKFKPDTTPAQRTSILAARKAHAFDRIPALNVFVVAIPSLQSHNQSETEAVARDINSDPNVEYAEPNVIYRASSTPASLAEAFKPLSIPNDPSIGEQWAWGVINAFSAWNTNTGSSLVSVAVVDTGVQGDHPDLDGKLVAGYDFVENDDTPEDGNGHGTHVSGTAAANTDNGIGGAGTCPDCSIMPVRVLNNSGSGTAAGVAKGITFAADHGAAALNLSLGGGGSETMEAAVNYAWNKGTFLACAAGNSNTNSKTYSYPAAYENCFAVAATNSTDARAYFSNYGDWVKLAAPGEDIYSSWLSGGYNTISGTSMATPHVAGAAGLLASAGLTNAQIRDRLCESADQIEGTGSEWSCGRLNLAAAVEG